MPLPYSLQVQPLKCVTCDAELIQTSARYQCCPHGHGGLVPNQTGTLAACLREDAAPGKAFEAALKYERRAAKRFGAAWREIESRAALALCSSSED